MVDSAYTLAGRDEFLQALRALGATLGPGLNGDGRDPSAGPARLVFLSCPQDNWLDAFGPPQNITEHYDLLMHVPFHAWQHQSADGPILCVGHWCEFLTGRRWVTISKVLFAAEGVV